MSNQISIIVTTNQTVKGSKSILGGTESAEIHDIDVDTLGENVKKQAKMLMTALEPVDQFESWQMKEVEVSAEISAEGGFSFIASTKANVGGTIKLKFVRK